MGSGDRAGFIPRGSWRLNHCVGVARRVIQTLNVKGPLGCVLGVIGGVVAAAFFVFFFGCICPIPPERILKIETSPDGRQTATYSWRPTGIMGAVTEDNPWVYLTIRDRVTGRIISRRTSLGDVPTVEEVEQRLGSTKPW